MTERREHCRVCGAMVDHVRVRVRAGGEGTLLNFSRRGASIAVRRPMPPGSWIDLQLSVDSLRVVARALVLRCSVRAIAALDGVTYETAVRFDQDTDLPREETALDGYSVHAQSGTNSVSDGSDLHALSEVVSSHLVEASK